MEIWSKRLDLDTYSAKPHVSFSEEDWPLFRGTEAWSPDIWYVNTEIANHDMKWYEWINNSTYMYHISYMYSLPQQIHNIYIERERKRQYVESYLLKDLDSTAACRADNCCKCSACLQRSPRKARDMCSAPPWDGMEKSRHRTLSGAGI